MLEESTHKIDMQIAAALDTDFTEIAESVYSYGKNWTRAEQIKEKINFLQSCVILSSSDEERQNFEKDLSSEEQALTEVDFEPLSPRSGPVCSQLDTILDKHNITPQSYHSRSFIGNHCHKYITAKVYRELTSYIIRRTQECTHKLSILDMAFALRDTFNELNDAYRDIHNLISHSRPIDFDTIPTIQTCINKYMTFYRKNFKHNVTPKQHILEKHCIPWMKKYGFGMAFHGEQGGELIHASVAKLERRAAAIRNKETHLKTILKSQHMQTSTQLLSSAPPIKKKEKQNKYANSSLYDF
ncbi:amine oxidase [Plakobranchus ocellatus]|uniref:Amine oxidase n=1 Tax=Plakobranchus ocellatus TaxID=259542 RepID=A0AAV3YAH6_9GAST|nr:amine oxidase [Plakobranchus ocellatus]